MWESQVLLTDGQVVFLRVLRFSPTFDERSARYKWNILERAVKLLRLCWGFAVFRFYFYALDIFKVSHRCGSILARVICGKAKFCLRMVRWFFSGFSGFRPPSMNDRLDISEIFLKGPLNPPPHPPPKKKKKKMCTDVDMHYKLEVVELYEVLV